MTSSKQRCSAHDLGPYRIRIRWLRVLGAAAFGFALGVSYAASPAPLRGGQRPAAKPVLEPASLPDLSARRPSPEDQAVLKILATRRLDLDFDRSPAAACLDFLSEASAVNIFSDRHAREAFENGGVTVSLELQQVRLDEALGLVLCAFEDLCYQVRDGVVVITTRDRATPLVLEHYDVRDLIDGRRRGHGGASVHGEKLLELLYGNIGDELEKGAAEINGPILSLRVSLEGHRAAARLIQSLRHRADAIPAEPTRVTELKAALEKTLSFNGAEVPMADFVRRLRTALGIPIAIHPQVSVDEIRLDLRFREAPARVILGLTLARNHLAYGFREGALFIHPEGTPCAPYSLRVLDLADLLSTEDEGPDCSYGSVEAQGAQASGLGDAEVENNLEPDTLIEMIRSEIGEELWDDPARIEVHRGQLLVFQTAAVHRAIDPILAKMRRVNWRGPAGR